MFDASAARRHRFNPEALKNAARLVAILAAIFLLAWMEWRFALH
jgi:hypothetical protein